MNSLSVCFLHFSSLAYKLTTIPPKVVARRMLPRLMSRFVLAEPSAEKNFLPHLLTPIKGTLLYSNSCFQYKDPMPSGALTGILLWIASCNMRSFHKVALWKRSCSGPLLFLSDRCGTTADTFYNSSWKHRK